MSASRSATIGPWARPVPIPQDFLIAKQERASGIITLPLNVWWSEPDRSFDLSIEEDVRRVYVLVLSEGTEDDISKFIDPKKLIDLWSDLLLPTHVQKAWEAWFRKNEVDIECL
jgi:hypothetical protein